MFRALLWKEWRGLRSVRWAGALLGVMLPPLFLAGAAAAARGWSPVARLSDSSTREVLLEAVPWAFALGLWPLLALLNAAQALVADRAAGTESFLLERPVPRLRIWGARLIAAAGSTLVSAAGAVLAWSVITAVSIGLPPGLVSGELAYVARIGAGTTALAFAGATLAASFTASPVAVLLAGLAFAAAPLGVGSVLVALFPHARYRDVMIGTVVPMLLPLGYVAVSYLALCRGEPAGRRRLLRAGTALGLAAAVVLITFAVASPAAQRAYARRVENPSIHPSPSGGPALLLTGPMDWWSRSGILFDHRTGREIGFLPPHIEDWAWNSAGTTLAVLTRSGPLGSVGKERFLFFDAEGREILEPLPTGGTVIHFLWAADRLIAQMETGASQSLVVLTPGSHDRRPIAVPGRPGRWGLAGQAPDGGVYLTLERSGAAGDPYDSSLRSTYSLHLIDPASASVLPEPLLVEPEGMFYSSYRRLSPTGRYWIRDLHPEPDAPLVVRDLSDHAEHTFGPTHIDAIRWLDGDAMAWVEEDDGGSMVLLGRPGQGARVIRTEQGASVGLAVSPDRRRLLAWVFPRSESEEPRFLLYDAATRRWADLETPWFDSIRWAGPSSLAHTGPGFLAVASIDAPGDLRPVIGTLRSGT